jgi:hypothetical protein
MLAIDLGKDEQRLGNGILETIKRWAYEKA